MLKAMRKSWTCYLFILPNFVGVLVFIAFPVLFALWMSFTDYDLLTPANFVGVQNYVDLFSNDDLFWTSIKNTVYYVLLTVPATIVLGLALAAAMNQAVRGISIYRTALYIPVLTSAAAIAFVWQWIFNTRYGVLNAILEFFGLPSIGWLTDENWSMISLAIISIWKNVGYYAVILFAALQGVPKVLYEAASLDGAQSWRRFLNITIPMIGPAILFVAVIAIIGSFQVFDQVFLITNINGSGAGGPGTSTYVYNIHLFNNAFRFFQMGYASAMAYILFAILFIITYLQLRVGRTRAAGGYEFS
jgi:multiple sugar transport system permease protein